MTEQSEASDIDADVVVVGLGTMGSMALWRIARRRNLRVVGVEQYGLVHSHGSFTGESRVFRTAYHEGTRYVPLLLSARDIWHELEADSGRQLLLEVGTLTIGHAGEPAVENVLASIREYELPHQVFDAKELRSSYPQHSVGDDAMGVLDLYGGGMRPELSVFSAIESAAANGATVLDHETVLNVEADGSGVVVTTERRVIRAKRAVIAQGSWARRLNPDLAAVLTVQPLPLTWFMPHHLELFTPDRFPAFIRDEGPVHFFGAPSLDGYSVKVTPRRFHDPVADVDEVPKTISAEKLSEIGHLAQEFFPDLNPEPVHWSVHHDAFTADKVPVIDAGLDGRVLTLAGFSGHGFKLAPGVGEIAAQFVNDEESPLLASDYSLAAHLR
ncbi:N-methyl-L-tryptophan oxidase [Pseudoclavibacter sp. CFCC 13796]|uniref:N-methyl-L-tryptophan oxidase n=1 Tax=Pseudoclavibacter sp. CFCC 13796 TaxID=2615179 RepID=UPI00130154CA|nr:N-methyl-L-tryptophan oxidase [Pseudoclavibacter sp. CFCC 13796]KAB1660822.1 N-methyl-L-tryptophan oxidase [Pseudoclavibacter sp. CFCC 13796]